MAVWLAENDVTVGFIRLTINSISAAKIDGSTQFGAALNHSLIMMSCITAFSFRSYVKYWHIVSYCNVHLTVSSECKTLYVLWSIQAARFCLLYAPSHLLSARHPDLLIRVCVIPLSYFQLAMPSSITAKIRQNCRLEFKTKTMKTPVLGTHLKLNVHKTELVQTGFRHNLSLLGGCGSAWWLCDKTEQ